MGGYPESPWSSMQRLGGPSEKAVLHWFSGKKNENHVENHVISWLYICYICDFL
jgi:hypothetical protein